MSIIILKAGSAELTRTNGTINTNAISKLVEFAVQAQTAGLKPVIVASGAVSIGRGICPVADRGTAAALGQSLITQAFTLAASLAGLHCALVKCTNRALEKRQAFNAIRSLTEKNFLPLVNENDVVASPEHCFGNNDYLAAELAIALNANLVCFFSSVGGIFMDFCSRAGCGNCLIEECPDCPLTDLIKIDAAPASKLGSGGVQAKVEAIELLRRADISSFVGALSQTESLHDVLNSRASGTRAGSFWHKTSPTVTFEQNSSAIFDLRSDTITQPDLGMRLAMAAARVGDDCYGDDPSVLELESKVQKLFAVERALLVTSGTMTNQIALRALTSPGDEVITHSLYHINFFESAQTADLARVALNCSTSEDGFITVAEVKKLLSAKPRGGFYAQAPLVWIEDTVAATGGRVYPEHILEELSLFCRKEGLHLHMDGARMLNAAASSGRELSYFSELVDSFSFCLSKSLGAPFGSVLCGKNDFIQRARKFRKWFGGGLHQAGFMAAAAVQALDANLSNFAEDHRLAVLLAELLQQHPVLAVKHPESNMLMLDVSALGVSANEFVSACEQAGVLLFAWSQNLVRITTHFNLNTSAIKQAASVIKDVANKFCKELSHVSELGLSN